MFYKMRFKISAWLDQSCHPRGGGGGLCKLLQSLQLIISPIQVAMNGDNHGGNIVMEECLPADEECLCCSPDCPVQAMPLSPAVGAFRWLLCGTSLLPPVAGGGVREVRGSAG